MILVVEDQPLRITRFQHALGHIHAADNLIEALRWMRGNNGYSTIYLDHDGVDGDLLAKYMARHKLHHTAKVRIHSDNYAGSVKMRDTLAAAGYDVKMVSFREVVG